MASLAKQILSKIYSRPYLLVTNTVTGVISITIGDVLQQNLEHYWLKNEASKHPEFSSKEVEEFVWDKKRTRNMMAAGVYFSIFGHWWYSWLDRRFPPNAKNSVKKKLIAESISGPLLVSSVFLLYGQINGKRFEDTWQNICSNFQLICAAEWLVFIPIQWINFSFVPIRYRYLYVATVSIGYDAFLSYVLHRNERIKHQQFLVQQQRKPISSQWSQMF